MQFAGVVVIRTEAQVAFPVEPNTQWVPTCDHDPLSDIELLIKDDKRVLDVLLYHPDVVVVRLVNGLPYAFQLRVNSYPTAS